MEICKGRSEIEISHIYYLLCNKGFLLDKETKYKKVENPKITIITTVYNTQNFLLRLLRSFQNQPMKDIEIIFVDDCSTDNSVQIIKKYQKEDERIILIEHETNKGTLISRNEGLYKAKGEYIMFVDSDDMILYDILNKSYEIAKNNNYEIVQFAMYRQAGNRYRHYGEIRHNNPIYQPELSSLMYYYRGYLKQTDFHLCGKLIKKEALFRALESIDSYYLNLHMSVNEDGLIDFMLLKKAKSFIYMNDYGYLYIINPKSVILSLDDHINKAIRDYILYLKYLFEHTDNNWYEKSMAGEQLKFVYNKFYKKMEYVTDDFTFMYDTLNLYINCSFTNRNNKIRAKRMKRILIKTEKNLKAKKK